MTMRGIVRSLAAAVLLVLAGCATPLDLPTGFVKVAGPDFRAVTADDARLWVRELHDGTAADLDFWAQSLHGDFTERRGYELVAQGDVEDVSGTAGRWFECAANVGGERIAYLVALWAEPPPGIWFWRSGTDLFVVEFAARQEIYAKHVDAVREALSSVRR